MRRSPSCPDYSGLDTKMPSQLDGHGGLALSSFTHWFAGVQRDVAQVLKQQRLMKDELAHLSKPSSSALGGDPNPGRAEENRARKAAAKAAKAAKAAVAGPNK